MSDKLFKEPEIQEIELDGVKCRIYTDVPYKVSRNILSKWFGQQMTKSKTENVDVKVPKSPSDIFDNDTISNMMDEIIVGIFVEPKITVEYLNENYCPQDLVVFAFSHLRNILEGMALIKQ